MKQCPACSRSYDDSLSFCLMDGTALTGEGEEKTIVAPAPPVRKKGKFLLWLGLASLFVLTGIGIVAGLLIYNYSRQNETVRAKRPPGANASPPTSTSAIKVSPTSASSNVSPVEGASPQTAESKANSGDEDEDAEDITPIAWDTTAAGFKGESGQTYKFRCPKEGTEQSVYGSDVYTQDSSICTAAVHAGLFSLAQGGVVTVEYRPGRATYGSTVRNGIKSRTWGEYPRSFVVR